MDTITLHSELETFQVQLIEWYDTYQRDLPWRTLSSLYKTVVSEFMLQQTQVKTVLPYFEKWMTDYPDFSALAKASENQVLKSWEGLGYYSRARNLHKLAQSIASLETIPKDVKSWLAFPGIGPYSAAAISQHLQVTEPEAPPPPPLPLPPCPVASSFAFFLAGAAYGEG